MLGRDHLITAAAKRSCLDKICCFLNSGLDHNGSKQLSGGVKESRVGTRASRNKRQQVTINDDGDSFVC